MDAQPIVPHPVVRPDLLVWCLGATQLIGWATLYFSFPVFALSLQDEFGWSATAVNGALTAGLFTADLAAIPVGRFVDRHGGRAVMTLGALLGVVLLLAMTEVTTLWSLYLVWIGIGLAQTSALNAPPYAVVTANVPNYRRALSHISFVTGLASTVGLPLAALLVSRYGWRGGLVGLAMLQFVGPVCIHFSVLRGTVGSQSRAPTTREPSKVARLMRTRRFWSFALAFGVHWFVSAGLAIHLLPLLHARGVDDSLAVGILALQGPISVASRMVVYGLGPDASARRVGRLVFPLLVIAVVLLALVGSGTPGLVLFAVAMGASSGTLLIVRQVGIADVFGTEGYGAVSGALATVSILPRTMAPLAMAVARDGFGGYGPLLWILAGLCALGALAFFYATAVAQD